MARPTKEGLDYFPHDTDAVNDEKIEALRSLYGNDGYAFYFILLERIYRSPDQEIDVSDAETIQVLARKVEVTKEKFAEMLQTALRWRCFDLKKYEEEGILTSNGIKKRARPVLSKRALMQDKYKEQKEEEVSGEFLKQKRGVKESKVKESTVPKDPMSDLSKDGPRGKDKSNTYDKESAPYKAAIYLRNKILANNPRERVPEDNPEDMQEWSLEMDRLYRLGPVGADPKEKKGYTWKEIKEIVDWCQDDEFWRGNIKSAGKLRQKITVLEDRVKGGQGHGQLRADYKPSGEHQGYVPPGGFRYNYS